MRLPDSAHTCRPWRIHELTRDFRLEDVWELPVGVVLSRVRCAEAASRPARYRPAGCPLSPGPSDTAQVPDGQVAPGAGSTERGRTHADRRSVVDAQTVDSERPAGEWEPPADIALLSGPAFRFLRSIPGNYGSRKVDRTATLSSRHRWCVTAATEAPCHAISTVSSERRR
jgi:hypothetical protein